MSDDYNRLEHRVEFLAKIVQALCVYHAGWNDETKPTWEEAVVTITGVSDKVFEEEKLLKQRIELEIKKAELERELDLIKMKLGEW